MTRQMSSLLHLTSSLGLTSLVKTFTSILFLTTQQTSFYFINIRSLNYFQSDDTRCCANTICPPEDGHVDDLNMWRIRIISLTNFNAQFSIDLTTYILHYYPRHVSSINVPIFRRKNCIHTYVHKYVVNEWRILY
jgi:hypothetical protein